MMKIQNTAAKRNDEMKTSPVNDSAMIKRKNMITPPHIDQNVMCSIIITGGGVSFSIMPKITDIVISETGKEKPRKKTSGVSFSKWNSPSQASLTITKAERRRAETRQIREALWNFSEVLCLALKNIEGKRGNFSLLNDSVITASITAAAAAGKYTPMNARKA